MSGRDDPHDLSSLDLDAREGSVTFGARVHPGARRTAVQGMYGSGLKVSVAAPPERGRANEALVELIAQSLGVPRACVEVCAGLTSRNKRVRVAGLTPSEVVDRLRLAARR